MEAHLENAARYVHRIRSGQGLFQPSRSDGSSDQSESLRLSANRPSATFSTPASMRPGALLDKERRSKHHRHNDHHANRHSLPSFHDGFLSRYIGRSLYGPRRWRAPKHRYEPRHGFSSTSVPPFVPSSPYGPYESLWSPDTLSVKGLPELDRTPLRPPPRPPSTAGSDSSATFRATSQTCAHCPQCQPSLATAINPRPVPMESSSLPTLSARTALSSLLCPYIYLIVELAYLLYGYLRDKLGSLSLSTKSSSSEGDTPDTSHATLGLKQTEETRPRRTRSCSSTHDSEPQLDTRSSDHNWTTYHCSKDNRNHVYYGHHPVGSWRHVHRPTHSRRTRLVKDQ